MRSVVIEMIRAVTRRRPGGETEIFTPGPQYLVSAEEAESLCAGDAPAARIVAEYGDTPTLPEAEPGEVEPSTEE